MKQKKNRRTLKKRIRKVMSISVFITVLIISGIISSLVLELSHKAAIYQADSVCQEIQFKLNSGSANQALHISTIKELNNTNRFIEPWLNEILKNTFVDKLDLYNMTPNKTLVRIEINHSIVYSNYEPDFSKWADFYSDTQSQRGLVDATGTNEIGTVTVQVNPKVLVPMVGMILMFIIIISLFALIVVNTLGRFLTLHVTKPIKQLEKKVKALAEGDNETALNTELVLKRPLREIESLAESTNMIMKKLHGYNITLEQQKGVLEQQNAELEEQNDELYRSKQQIQEQQAQLIQSEKMASVGLLTAAITHEINTPIGAINSNAQLSDMLLTQLNQLQQITSDDELISLISQLKEVNDINLMACKRIIEIIKSLKSFSRLDQAEFQDCDINEGINSVLVLTNNLLKNRITVHKDFEDIPTAQCFPGQLNQVFMNIIVNASQAIEGEGELFVRTYRQDEYIFITIRDTGMGIDPENLNKIFEPGYTTKGVGVGLGIGLYLSYNIIHNHKGEISVTSEPGKGTQFTIKLPISH